jgi:hypothetical protein
MKKTKAAVGDEGGGSGFLRLSRGWRDSFEASRDDEENERVE